MYKEKIMNYMKSATILLVFKQVNKNFSTVLTHNNYENTCIIITLKKISRFVAICCFLEKMKLVDRP